MVVDTSSSVSATASSGQRRNFKDTDTGTSWVFWFDGTAIAYASSADGISWTTRGALPYATTAFSVAYRSISFIGYVFVAVESDSQFGDVVLRRGTLAAAGVTFDDEVTVFSAGGSWPYLEPAVSTDALGYVWVAAQYAEPGAVRTKTRRTTGVGDEASLLWNAAEFVGATTATARDTVLVPQGTERMALVLGAPDVELYRYAGSSWTGPATGGTSDGWSMHILDEPGPVYAVAVSGSDVFAGGGFTDAGGLDAADYVARWDGSAWHALGPGLNGMVNAVAVIGTDVFVGGAFTDAGGVAAADYIARWDGSTWHAVGPGLNGAVHALAVSGTDLVVAGEFTDAGGVAAADHIARWQGSGWRAIGPGLSDNVFALTVQGSELLAGGAFLDAGSNADADHIARWTGSAWTAFGIGVTDTVEAIAVNGTDVLVGGAFTTAGGTANADRIARWDGTAWQALHQGVLDTVEAVAVSGTDVFIGGAFLNASSNPNADGIARWDGTAWQALDGGQGNAVHALVPAAEGSRVFAGSETSFAVIGPAFDVDASSAISVVSDAAGTGTVHVLYTTAASHLALRTFEEPGATWRAPATVVASTVAGPSLMLDAGATKLLAFWVQDGRVMYNGASAPFDTAAWSGSSTEVFNATPNAYPSASMLGTESAPLLSWTHGTAPPYDVYVWDVACTPSAVPDDTCDGADDDCDGLVDEDYVSVPITCGAGACQAAGTTSCDGGSVQNICSPGDPAPDDSTCDGVDDDCDSSVDEDANAACDDGLACNGTETCSAGACQAGTAMDCSGQSDACNTGSCNEGTDACEALPKVAGFPCGDPTNDACTDPDTCNGAGACQSNHEVAGWVCGDSTDDACTDPDTCDGAGVCTPNDAAVGAPCGDQGVPCRVDDSCDGSGTCVDAGAVADGQSCDDGLACNGTETCSAGACQAGTAMDCSGQSDACNTGSCNEDTDTCEALPKVAGTPCGDPTNDACTDPDTCDGAGTCQSNHEVAGWVCGDSTDDACTDPDTCDGAGACSSNHAAPGAPCDDQGVPCRVDDSCDGSGTCLDAGLVADGQSCDDGLACNGTETCSAGACQAGTAMDCSGLNDACNIGVCNEDTDACEAAEVGVGFPCGDPTYDGCTDPDTCDSAGACQSNHAPAGWACGDPTANDCTAPDTCDGAGACSSNHAAPGAPCDDQGVPCHVDDSCDGSGTCLDAGLVADGQSCDDGDACTTADACQGGACAGTPRDCSHLSDGCTVGTCRQSDGVCVRTVPPEGSLCPVITSTPDTSFLLGVPYRYDGDGRLDASGAEPIVWSLQNGPEGMTIDSSTGEVSWMPSTLGPHPVRIVAENDHGSASHAFDLARAIAEAPSIVDDANGLGTVGDPYAYNTHRRVTVANTLAGEALTVRVVDGPVGFVVSPSTHEVGWLPRAAGLFEVTLALESEGAQEPWSQIAFTVDVKARDGVEQATAIKAALTVEPTRGVAPLSVALDARGSTGTDSSAILSYQWDLGTALGDLVVSGAPLSEFTYEQPQGANITLRITDVLGYSAEAKMSVVVLPAGDVGVPPSALITADALGGDVPLTVSFSCDCSDPDGNIVAYHWQSGDGIVMPAEPISTHTFTHPGTYRVRLTVEDDTGLQGRDTQLIDVRSTQTPEKLPPSVQIVASSDGDEPPVTVTLASEAQDPDGFITAWRWLFHDGSTASGPVALKDFSAAGHYDVRLEVEDNDGLRGHDEVTLDVRLANRLPPRIISLPQSHATVGEPYLYDADGRPAAQGSRPLAWSVGRTDDGAAVGAVAGFIIDATSGVITWTPTAEQVGPQRIWLVVENDLGADGQHFQVTVAQATAPPSESKPAGQSSGCGCDVASQLPAGRGLVGLLVLMVCVLVSARRRTPCG